VNDERPVGEAGTETTTSSMAALIIWHLFRGEQVF
jgi:hypothetical protein